MVSVCFVFCFQFTTMILTRISPAKRAAILAVFCDRLRQAAATSPDMLTWIWQLEKPMSCTKCVPLEIILFDCSHIFLNIPYSQLNQ